MHHTKFGGVGNRIPTKDSATSHGDCVNEAYQGPPYCASPRIGFEKLFCSAEPLQGNIEADSCNSRGTWKPDFGLSCSRTEPYACKIMIGPERTDIQLDFKLSRVSDYV